MPRRRRPFKRRAPFLSYRKLFLIATEGARTEPFYFDMFNSPQATIHVKLLPAKKHDTSPPQVLKRAEEFVKEKGLGRKDEVWLVMDRDQWTDEQLHGVCFGCRISAFNLAVSNPQFEYWLLLHFEDGSGVSGSRECTQRLMRYLPHFNKAHLEVQKVKPGISDAIYRAEAKDTPPCEDWPKTNGSTVYRLVKKLREPI
ncbi:MAG: RloB domain-containing protein [Desulfobacteraceae bacterium]|nr:RloB domain-containing protein [Desulfobacteraceae bacterium]